MAAAPGSQLNVLRRSSLWLRTLTKMCLLPNIEVPETAALDLAALIDKSLDDSNFDLYVFCVFFLSFCRW